MSDPMPAADVLAPWREPVRGGYPDPGLFGLAGVDQLRALLAGPVKPPLWHLTGMHLVEVGTGNAAFEMPLTEWLCASRGAVSIGSMAIPADAALGIAVQSVLPPATALATSELSLRLLAPARPGASVIARARVITARRTIALSEVLMTDGHGRLLAHGSCLCFIFPRNSPTPAPLAIPEPREPATHETVDPWARAPQGGIVAQEVWDRMSGLEVLHALIAGELQRAPIGHLTGLRPTSASAGVATFAMPTSEWLSVNKAAPPNGRVQGGAVALLAEAALSSAAQTMLPAGTALAPFDLKVNFLRPLRSDGREATARGTVLHAGRRITVASSQVHDADGKAIALATGSAMVLPTNRATRPAP